VKISRREALGLLGGLAVLMGVPSMVDARPIKPAAPLRIKHDPNNIVIDGSSVSFDQVMEAIRRYTDIQTDEDLSYCVHVINPDRMADMGGCTVMTPVRRKVDDDPIVKIEVDDEEGTRKSTVTPVTITRPT
jgi:hypothetical protein